MALGDPTVATFSDFLSLDAAYKHQGAPRCDAGVHQPGLAHRLRLLSSVHGRNGKPWPREAPRALLSPPETSKESGSKEKQAAPIAKDVGSTLTSVVLGPTTS